MTQSRIRLGMVGGGQGAFIGSVHRMAARLDGRYQLVAGALSSNKERAKTSGLELGFNPERIYTDFNTMAKAESARADGIEVVAIVTPNHMHAAPIKAFLEHGIHVICDKPLTTSLLEAQKLLAIKPANNAKFLLTHNYTGYPMVRQAKAIIEAGMIGNIRHVNVEYLQDWLSEDIKNKQADWRANPELAGLGGAIGDIGTHAYNLMRFITDLQVNEINAELRSFVAGRKLDDHAQIMIRFKEGALGLLTASQVTIGCENDLSIRIVGDKASLNWSQQDADTLWYCPLGEARQQIRRGGALPIQMTESRLPAGHPEGYIEAFATLYYEFADIILNHSSTQLLPTMQDGLEGIQFISASIKSSQAGGIWQPLEFDEY